MTDDLNATITVQRPDFTLHATLTIPAGRTIALLGRNGAGKSTLLAALTGFLPIADGRISLGPLVLDEPATGTFVPTERRPVGLVQQRTALFPHLSVLDNVAFGLRRAGLTRAAARTTAQTALDNANLGALARRRGTEVSGGQAARIALVRALVRKPALLLLDEPLAAIDAESRPALRRSLQTHLGAFDGTAIIVTHDIADAEPLTEHAIVLDAGSIAQTGTIPQLRATPALPIVAALIPQR
jgi:molybdate transport system ATP-binding protein